MKTHRHRETLCPRCGRKLNASSGPHNLAPDADALTVCAYCSTILAFDKALALREVPEAEFNALPAELRRELAEGVRFTLTLRGQRAS